MRAPFTIAALLLISSTANAQREAYVVTPEYKGKGITGSTLVIAPLTSGLAVKNPDDVTDDLGTGTPSDVVRSFIQAYLPALLREHSSFRDVQFGVYAGSPTLGGQTLAVGRKWLFWPDQMTMDLPPRGSAVGFGGFQPEFILFMQDFTVERDKEADAQGGSATVLRYRTKYAIWDVRQARLVGYGRAQAYDFVWFRMRRETWHNGLRNLAQAIMRRTPFRN